MRSKKLELKYVVSALRRTGKDTMKSTLVASMIVATSAALLAQGPPAGGGQGRGRGPQTPPLLMTTTAWEDGGVIPDKYTQAAGPDAPSPELKWSQVPMGTQSFVLLLHDPEPALNKGLMDVTHWLVWNIPATATGLPEGVPAAAERPDGARQVSLRANGFMGPGAPANGP